ncbi:MAG: tRNA (adenosine(37)-N6)-threonylcarbamoyltransferase complex ATPase subunit type 1 TsaE [Oscillospiraceae bacterium]|nr:tRNA (adenosine(37)-N6)-threonylcarbamoyltransferase complex ATPase subunit type 1 TsaE [Oscillospiraceae bacterium]
MTVTTHSADETIQFGRKIGQLLKKGDIIAFIGGLGSGKTTITSGIAEGMGNSVAVMSPTFTLVNEYRAGEIEIYHFDMYRIIGEDALESTGFFDYPLHDSVFIIEWAENILECLPENTIFIKFEYIDENTRKIEINGDERFADIGN